MFLLVRYPGEPVQRKNGPLHSTMFLLIPEAGKFTWEGFKNFTFHNVSINTHIYIYIDFSICSLHSTMFLLILCNQYVTYFFDLSLHSTMFLLIRLSSIRQDLPLTSLHSTMFLLIQNTCKRCRQRYSLYIPQCFY